LRRDSKWDECWPGSEFADRAAPLGTFTSVSGSFANW